MLQTNPCFDAVLVDPSTVEQYSSNIHTNPKRLEDIT